jgi:osmotically-inducible protein OsmY
MNTRTGWGLVALGAGLMYMLDPNTGRRRRAITRDKAAKYARRSAERAQALAQQAADRAKGLIAEARASDEEWVDDPTLVARVRSELGRVVSHPGSLHVDAVDGCVTLRGPVFVWEAESALAAVENTRGVCGVEDQMTRHEQPGNVPGLQGQGH